MNEEEMDIVSATEMTGIVPVMPQADSDEGEFLTLVKVCKPKDGKH